MYIRYRERLNNIINNDLNDLIVLNLNSKLMWAYKDVLSRPN
ncbi:hypothetical protein MDMS009_2075 [Methylophaga thiooxydans DMS010]|uniref:Uncharacterized protein n=1 Tax=Methylophaga thiooxydans DMS010 TaxID=637616 RepID=C0N6F4_9GAMM|nr:hypothetical protein MDMS009_2075 [Methylophaga thiooxydans DMS010]